MPIPAIAGATVPIKAIQAWLKSQRGRSKVMRMGEAEDTVHLGVQEKGLVDEIGNFVQQIFMQKGMEQALKKGVSVKVKEFGAFGTKFNIKGPITKKELKILTDARAKSEAKYRATAQMEKEGGRIIRTRPVYMQFRGKKMEVDDLAEIEDEIKRQMFSDLLQSGNIVP